LTRRATVGATSRVRSPAATLHDGQHDASTDLVRFAGALCAAFRHAPAWQADPTAQVFIVRSGDKGRTWKRTPIVSVAGRALRAPRLTVFKDELWLTATAWETADPSAHRTTRAGRRAPRRGPRAARVPLHLRADKNVAALGYEPSGVAAQAAGFAADVLAVELYMPSAAAGR
jgi:hypothetical protein